MQRCRDGGAPLCAESVLRFSRADCAPDCAPDCAGGDCGGAEVQMCKGERCKGAEVQKYSRSAGVLSRC